MAAFDPENITLFNLPENPSPADIAASFKIFPFLSAPLEKFQESALPVFCIPELKKKPVKTLPALTHAKLLTGQGISKPTAHFLKILFTSTSVDFFTFNPAELCAPGTRELTLDKPGLAGIIGSLSTNTVPRDELATETAFRQEASLGNLFTAVYFAALRPELFEQPSMNALYAQTLAQLGLLSAAYDRIKLFRSHEEYYCGALIARISGDTAKARQWLEKIPADSGLETQKSLELAWLDLEENKTDAAITSFNRLAGGPFDKPAALFGLGTALAKKTGNDPSGTQEAIKALMAALLTPTPFTGKVLELAGNLHFKAGRYAEAEAFYSKAAAKMQLPQTKANLCLSLIKNRKLNEAAAVIRELAMTEPALATRLSAALPADEAKKLLTQEPETAPSGTKHPAPEKPKTDQAAFTLPNEQQITITIGSDTPRETPSAKTKKISRQEFQMESAMETAAAVSLNETESKKDKFYKRAFDLTTNLEDETNKKIFFNTDGLIEAERRLRLVVMELGPNAAKSIETVKDCAAFLCYMLQERYRGSLAQMPDFDPWAWPMTFNAKPPIVTYPIQRVWKSLWQETVPEPGWLPAYVQYLGEQIKDEQRGLEFGQQAVRLHKPSHPERITDTDTEHKRMLILASSLVETSSIHIGASGLTQIEAALKASFSPSNPPDQDGWKMLRCYGHLFAEILIKDFKAQWFNTDGTDGFWSMRLPWNTFVFPLGKTYKSAAKRESLSVYYNTLLEEQKRFSGES